MPDALAACHGADPARPTASADAPVRGFLTRYVELGGPHHNAVCFGDAAARLTAFADAAGLDIEEI